jgi:hypothetical protein
VCACARVCVCVCACVCVVVVVVVVNKLLFLLNLGSLKWLVRESAL